MTEREHWVWENMIWGGTVGWQVECARNAILVVGVDGKPLIAHTDQWTPDYKPLEKK
jgi:hypothetical protein